MSYCLKCKKDLSDIMARPVSLNRHDFFCGDCLKPLVEEIRFICSVFHRQAPTWYRVSELYYETTGHVDLFEDCISIAVRDFCVVTHNE